MAEPSFLTGAAEKPDSFVSSSNERSEVSVSTGTLGTVTGVFLGCSYTNPTTKQRQFAQYWPGGTTAGDAVAIVCDDPDTVFKAVICSSGTTVASGARAMIGQNLAMINNTGNVNTGDSANALLAPNDTPATTDALPIRVLGLVPDTVVSLGSVTYTSISTATVTCSALPFALPVGTDVGSLAANGQYIPSGSFVDTAAAAGAALAPNVASDASAAGVAHAVARIPACPTPAAVAAAPAVWPMISALSCANPNATTALTASFRIAPARAWTAC